MTYCIQKHPSLSGKSASIYCLYCEEDKKNLLEQFVNENYKNFPYEVKDILKRLKSIGHKTGARESFFKPNEGKLGDGVCALYDNPDKNLRLFCIRNGTVNVIIGSGGEKPKNIKAFQESPKLTDEKLLFKGCIKAIFRKNKSKRNTLQRK